MLVNLAVLPRPRDPIDTPERALWRAVLEEGLRAARGFPIVIPNSGATEPILRQDARRWIASSRTAVGSLEWICDALTVDSGALRAALDRVVAMPHVHRVASGFIRTKVGRRRKRAA